MNTNISFFRPLLAVGLLAATAACGAGDDPVAPPVEAPASLLSVQPQGGATGVDPDEPVVVEFDHAMMAGMEEYAALHEGELAGPEVPGAWSMSGDYTRLTFTPDAPLEPQTTYVIHLGGGMMDADGNHLDFESYGEHMGGEWATGDMMSGGMMGGGMGGGMGGQGQHMGDGWQHPTNDSYGMVFSFTTGG